MRECRTFIAGARRGPALLAVGVLALGLAACSGTGTASGDPMFPDDVGGQSSDEFIPTFPPDDLSTDPAACIDGATMAIIDQLRAPDADVPALLGQHADALIEGLDDLASAIPETREWRDALLTALAEGDIDAAAAQVARLVAGEVTITPC
ncbi:MAG TPA: hypothetical protein VNL94_05770 [Candidatus Binatia bacterium]|nr:hypothetical protein [Candidatus Binatia bacterium]